MSDPRTDLDAKLEAEIQAALGDLSLEDMLDLADGAGKGDRSERDFKVGTVVSVRGDDVFVEFGPKSQGVCPLSQFQEPPQSGQRLEFVVDRFDPDEGLLMLSRQGAVRKAQWESLDVGQVVEARCTGFNKGGLEMEVASHAAFMPAGQIDLRHVEDLSVFVGEKLPCEILELDRRRGRIILSRRNVLAEERLRLREKLLESLEVGQEIPGVITRLQPFGAFVDLGGIDGLVHISDLSYSRINDPAEVVKVGQQVTVKVLKVDLDADPPRIGLGLKQTMADPFQSSVDRLEEGGVVTGRVTKIMPFGAFVEISPGVEGLVHISELSHERVADVSRVVKENEILTVRILKIDAGRQRISLSLKAMKDEQEAAQPRTTDRAMERLKARFGDSRNLKGGLG